MPDIWSYRKISVFRADRNSSGIRWYARTDRGILRSDTKAGMRQMICDMLAGCRPGNRVHVQGQASRA